MVVEPEEGLQTEESCCPIYDEKGNPVETAGGRNRTRVPQYKAAHGSFFLFVSCLTAGGADDPIAFYPMVLQALKKFFPDFKTTIRNAGGM